MTKLGMLDTGITSHQELIEQTKSELEDHGSWMKTPEIVDELDSNSKIDMDDDYIRALLTYIRQHLNEKGEIEIRTEREGGHATFYWRLDTQ